MVKKARPILVKRLIASLTFFCLIGLLPALSAADLTPGTSDPGLNIGTGTKDSIYALAIEKNGGTLAGGRFTQISGFNKPNLTRFRKDGQIGAAFTPQVDDAVFAVVVQQLKICQPGFQTLG